MPQNLSLFHAELLAFIQKSASERIGVEGFDPSLDKKLATFQEQLSSALDPQCAKDETSFPELVEKYQYLFDVRGPLHLERKLLEAFSPKQAGEYSMRMYRGLPRLYHVDNPNDWHVKKNFNHLPTLKRLACEKALFQNYDAFFVPLDSRVTFFSWVMGDGMGDYVAAFESIEILKKALPDIEISWIVFVPQRFGSLVKPNGCKVHQIIYTEEAHLSLIDREALQLLRTSDLIIQMPTFYPFFHKMQDQVQSIPFSCPVPQWMSIGEYGFVESSWFHPRSGNRSMGLHFLEKGIITKQYAQEKEPRFADLESKLLLTWIFATQSPQSMHTEEYKKTHHLYFAYLATHVGGAVYLHALIYRHERDRSDIDIVMPDFDWLIRYMEMQTQQGRPILEVEGIALELYYQNNFCRLCSGTKKTIRLFCPPTITMTDFHALIRLSEEFVGIRGNQSLTEVVSVNKCFFYDGRDHARYVLKDLLAFAENRIGAHRSAVHIVRGMQQVLLHNLSPSQTHWVEDTYFQEKTPWVQIAQTMGHALQDNDAIAGFKKMNHMIRTEHSFNDFLCHAVRRELCQRADPSLLQKEEKAVSLFATSQISLLQMKGLL